MNQSLYIQNRYKHYYTALKPLIRQQKIQAYAMVTLSLFTMAFFGFFAVRPTLKTIAVLQRQIEDRSFVDKQLEEKINALIQAQEEYQRHESIVSTIYSLLPEKSEFSSLLIKLEELTNTSTASLTGIQIDPLIVYAENPVSKTATPTAEKPPVLKTSTSSVVTPLTLTITYNGRYVELRTILQKLVLLNRLVTINSAELLMNKSQSADSTLTVTLHTQAYYYPLQL